MVADVNNVRDIHPNYPVTSVPSLLEFSNGQFVNLYKGCNDGQYYKSIFENTVFEVKGGEEKPQKNVVVYSTPSCSWCNTLKKYLDEHKIRYRNVDVSTNQKMAEEMVKKSGQQGVPQTLINGEIIVGFDRPRINRLLGIKA
ncbi:MAG: NrdH-redoxin [Chlorobi bacterium]|nr:NrdH-redoxin [Chlorobiota bacterium]